MAGERKGKAYEAVVLVALEELRAEGLFKGSIYWEKTPTGMTIKPDIMIGPSEDRPDYSILITQCTSVKNSDMKMWRNFGELVETKTCLPTVPRVFSFTFGTIKEDLERIQAWAFDVFRWCRGEKWHAELDALADELTSQKELKVAAFPEVIRERNPRAVLNPLKKLLKDCFLSRSRPQMKGLWELHRQRRIPPAPSSRETHVRRGLAKLLVFEDLELGARIHDGCRVPKDQVPSYAFELGLAQKSTREAWGVDPEIQSVIELLGRDQAIALARKSLQPQMEQWYYTLRNRPLVPAMARWIIANYSNLCRPEWFRDKLIELYYSPEKFLSKPPDVAQWPPPTVWLFEVVMQLVRASTGSANGYGYGQLFNELLARYGGRLKGGGEPPRWRFVLPDWVHRRGNKSFSPEELLQVTTILSERLVKISFARAKAILSEMAEANATHILEAKVIPYRMFDPIGKLLESNIPGFKETQVDVCFREASGVRGQAGRMVIGKAKHTLINWQSCTDSGRDHKKKELCGRAVGLRYHWNGTAFVPRPGVNKLILVLDGTWKDEDIQALVRAGWDEIYYPDEMDRLVKAIV